MEHTHKMTRVVVRIIALLAVAALAFAASPVATVTSSGALDLHGAAVRTEGIPSWPVMAGDMIGTHGAPALIRFRDGSSVTLSEDSRAKVEDVDHVLTFRLLSGAMQVTSAQNSALQFYNNTQAVSTRAGVPLRVSAGPVGGKPTGQAVRTPVDPGPVSGR